MMYHEPVLLQKSIDGLNINPDGVYVDVTYGGGGHSKEILNRLKGGKLIAFDQDEDALHNVIDDERLILVNANFRFIKNFLMFYKVLPVDGILADLGISSHQIDDTDRGLSTRFNSELDLRMDRKSGQSAKEVLASYTEEELKKMFFEFGEMNNAKSLAKAIVMERENNEIVMVNDIKKVLERFAERGRENKFYAKVFQALRIEINHEIEALDEFLKQSIEVLKQGGRLVVISYHSLEDRLVKNYMKSGNAEGNIEKDFYGHEKVPYKMITRKPVVPSEEEIEINKRARSAKLRIAIKN
ncbi:MAG: 16S rRNA (cytosine(1402)-N(4))-methyltransferase RsmH [Bacteroidales bacterium]|jgi:16S rRNA (cytosine1402-N4)-methyltransferase